MLQWMNENAALGFFIKTCQASANDGNIVWVQSGRHVLQVTNQRNAHCQLHCAWCRPASCSRSSHSLLVNPRSTDRGASFFTSLLFEKTAVSALME